MPQQPEHLIPLRRTGGSRYPWWGDRRGERLYLRTGPWPKVSSPCPHHGYRIGVRHDGVVVQAPYPGDPLFPLPASAGTHGGAWCGTYLPSNQSVALGAPPRPTPSSPYRQKDVTPHSDAGPESTPLFVLPVKTGTHGGVTRGERPYLRAGP